MIITQSCPDCSNGTVRFHAVARHGYVGRCDDCGGRYELVAWPQHWRERGS